MVGSYFAAAAYNWSGCSVVGRTVIWLMLLVITVCVRNSVCKPTCMYFVQHVSESDCQSQAEIQKTTLELSLYLR